MATLITNCLQVQKGTEYTNFTGQGNAILLSEDTRISINRSPFGLLKAGYHMFVHSSYTYSFEASTALFITNEIVPDFYVVNEAFNTADISLSGNTESASIVGVSDPKAITSGELACSCVVENTTNQEQTVLLRMYATTGTTLLHTSDPFTLLKNTHTDIVEQFIIDGVTIAAGDTVYFTLESSGNATVKGTIDPSHIRLTRKNL